MGSPEAFGITFLANALWQVFAVAAAAWAGAQLLRRAPAAYRHWLWVAALALSVLVPLAGAARQHASGERPDGRAAGGPALELLPFGVGASAPGTKALELRAGPRSALVRAVLLAYLLVGVSLCVRLIRAWRRTGRIVRSGRPAPARLAGLAAAQAARMDAPPAELRVSAAVAAPLTFGILRPVVVLPEAFAREATADAVSGALAHELTHVKRRDCALNLACELFALPLGFHPAVRVLRRRIVGARETACDEAAASVVGPGPYAVTLLEMALRASQGPRLGAAGALGALDGDALEDRMQRVLENGAKLGRRRVFAASVLAVALITLAGHGAAALAVQVTTEPGPDDMVGAWKGEWGDGRFAGQPAAELQIALGPNGPQIGLTLFRYAVDGTRPARVEHPSVVEHRVEKGILYFRTRDTQPRGSGASETIEADWQLSIVGKDAGELRVRILKLAAERAEGRNVPPPPPPLVMRRVARGPQAR